MSAPTHFEAIVIGGGPAGLTAGIYLSRSRVRTLLLDGGIIGGQMVLTHEIANYPGVEPMSGYQLATIMRKQAQRFGCQIQGNSEVQTLDLAGEVKTVKLQDGRQFTADAVILTPGGRPRTLGVPGEDSFKGKGISYCATCDGDFFTDKEIMVVGGGNSALEEAVSLTRYARKITVVHQFDHFQAHQHAIDEARTHPAIHFIMGSMITAFHGTDQLEGVEITHLGTGKKTFHPTNGVFIFIGYVPNTEFLKGKLGLNEAGEIVADSLMATDTVGVFAAGDCIAKRYRQVTTAIGEATVAALEVANFLNDKKRLNPLT